MQATAKGEMNMSLQIVGMDVFVSAGYKDAPAIETSENGGVMWFTVGYTVYDPKYQEAHNGKSHWINMRVKVFDAALMERINKMNIKAGSRIHISGEYQEDWKPATQNEAEAFYPYIRLESIRYAYSNGGKSDNKKGDQSTGTPADTPPSQGQNAAPAASAPPAAGPTQSATAPGGGFDGYSPFDAGGDDPF